MYKLLLKQKKYQFIYRFKKAGLLAAFVLLTGLLYAQPDDEPVMDTIYQETTPIVTEEVQQDDNVSSNTYDPYSSSSNYFKHKWEYTSALDSVRRARRLSAEEVNKLRNDDDFWYANYVFSKEEEEKAKAYKSSDDSHKVYDAFLWVIAVIGFVAFLIIYLSNSNVGMFRRSKNLRIDDESDPEMDDIFGINYEKEIEKAVNAGNYRLGVRLLFLRLLRRLSDKNVIQYKQDRTNFDYVMQLSNTTWYNPFIRLARHYEYVWYGKFSVDQKQFEIIRNEFNNLDRKL
jgi:hypothetical protein